ncbi:flavodoxin family protein [Alicyclobacillus macrosporangiidus]|jgi:multimeric flavodoxin WrbA|uniref:Multimeric flavodoxin WrbA n=1 Tax=Alicyclobacillus macrosporangiidus TaxID=392015 RepID=A0A1I7JV78_9BACL|nr:flavodoxin family protein [Alicyclobacillus macrosporangiidus]SFU89046.1 Multimeric flavodoxin WrbA [Alicyclobacillus macrosporangiidus]
MSVLAIYGSSRRHGNTEWLADRVVDGLPAEKIYLVEKNIRPIADCRHDPAGFAPVDDDYDSVMERVLAHDTLVFATPVYWYGMSGLMKNFIDRWSQSLRDRRYDFRENMGKKSACVVLVGGDDPRIKALPLVEQFRYIFDFMDMRFIGYVVGEANRPGDIVSDAAAMYEASLLNARLRQTVSGSAS